MPDPFWQQPFKPDCDSSTFSWDEDDGSGKPNVTGPPVIKYFAHHPLVEAASTLPSGMSLPTGIKLTYDPSNVISPPFYPNGIPIGDDAGNYGSFEKDWGFIQRACANTTRFVSDYAYISCP
jgi:hypothetical protein